MSEKSKFSEIEISDSDDNVSIMERSTQTNWGIIIFKICLGLLFIGFATGCIIYSVLTSDEYIHHNTTNLDFYPYNISQYCNKGSLTWTNRTGSVNDYDKISVGVSWIQDSERQRIFHRIGIEEDDKDWVSTYYVFGDHSFLITKNGCERRQIGYMEFLIELGLEKIRKNREESFKINGRYVEVNYYEGEPARDVIIEGLHPAIIRGYSTLNNTFDYGWEYIFPQTDDSTGLFRKEYWFPTMVSGEPDFSIFENIPDYCYKTNSTL